MKVYLLVYRFGHHYSISGYNRLADFLPCSTIEIPRVAGWILKAAASRQTREERIAETGLTGYFPECRWLEWMTGLRARLPREAVFHYIYPENSYFYTPNFARSRKSRIVATYHQPVAESRNFILKTDPIRKLDGVILMSESQREFFEPLVGSDRLFVVHHGIDLEYFRPSDSGPVGEQIVAVGNWLRDFPTLASALRLLNRRRPSLVCNVITLTQNRGYFNDLPNVRFHSGISDLHLKKLYHEASASVLSLAGTAANNALLESLACGLPVVATDLPAIREYTSPEGARYVRRADPEHLAQTIIDVLDDGTGRKAMSEVNKLHVRQYDWRTVADQTMNVYRRVASG